MKFMQEKRTWQMINSQLQVGLLQDRSQQENYKQKEKSTNIQIDTDWSQQLYQSRDRLKKFIQQLKEQRNTPIRLQLIEYYQSNMKSTPNNLKNIKSEDIIKLINLRIQKMVKNKKIKKNWSQQDLKVLVWLISKYSDKNQYQDVQKYFLIQDWQFISKMIPASSAQACMFKWLNLKKTNLATSNWTLQQSNLLRQIAIQKKQFQSENQMKNQFQSENQMKDWKIISQKLYKLNKSQDKIYRNAKQCRQHWNCFLNPGLKKGPWNPKEDVKLFQKILQHKGCKKWSQIVKSFDGRTQNALKNRFTLILQKQKKKSKSTDQIQLITEYLQKFQIQEITSVMKHSQSKQQQMKSQFYQFKPFSTKSSLKNQQNFSSMELQNNQPKKYQKLTCQKQKIQDNQINNQNRNNSVQTPVKIQKFNMQNFSNFSKSQFFKFIKPGVINSNGIFSQIKSSFIVKKGQLYTLSN